MPGANPNLGSSPMRPGPGPAAVKSAEQITNAPIVGGSNVSQTAPSAQEQISVNQQAAARIARQGRTLNVSSDPVKPPPAVINFNGKKTDLRVKIEVPSDYLKQYTTGYGGNLNDLHGIIFPFTPQINIEHKAEYSSQNPIHSNHAINFYKNSMVGDISIQGIFTVQNKKDAITYLATVHLLRALTKGRFGGSDPLRGNPPPVCRLHAYGTFMLDNVPVAVTSFKNDLPGDVDYFYLNDPLFGQSYVPTKSTINVNLKPMFSRQEMLDATVPDWLSNASQRMNGLL
jgi:hypothetical protein